MIPKPKSVAHYRRGVHYLWWSYCTAVAVGAITLGRPVIIAGADRNPLLLMLGFSCVGLLIAAITRGGTWVTAFIVITGFDYCLRVGALVVDESLEPLPPKSRALAALLYGGFTFSLGLTYGTWRQLEGEGDT